jgi:hypothetical protein
MKTPMMTMMMMVVVLMTSGCGVQDQAGCQTDDDCGGLQCMGVVQLHADQAAACSSEPVAKKCSVPCDSDADCKGLVNGTCRKYIEGAECWFQPFCVANPGPDPLVQVENAFKPSGGGDFLIHN